jgi:hypothetical protein
MQPLSEPHVTIFLCRCAQARASLAAGWEVTAMYRTGEKPGKGRYQCTVDAQIVVLDDDSDTLPPCPRCNNTTFIKVG